MVEKSNERNSRSLSYLSGEKPWKTGSNRSPRRTIRRQCCFAMWSNCCRQRPLSARRQHVSALKFFINVGSQKTRSSFRPEASLFEDTILLPRVTAPIVQSNTPVEPDQPLWGSDNKNKCKLGRTELFTNEYWEVTSPTTCTGLSFKWDVYWSGSSTRFDLECKQLSQL